jgi:hypothetical protein
LASPDTKKTKRCKYKTDGKLAIANERLSP